MKRINTICIIILIILLNSCNKSEPVIKEPTSVDVEIKKIVGSARIEPAEGIIDLAISKSGIVAKIYVSENEILEKGTPILELNQSTEIAQIEQYTNKLYTQNQTIKAQEIALSIAKTKRDKAKLDYENDLKLMKSKALSANSLEDSRVNYETAKLDFEKAEVSLKESKSRFNEYKADLEYQRSILNKTILRAPYDGTLLSLDVKVGENINGGVTIGEYAPKGFTVATMEVDELFAYKVKTGQNAEIRSQSTGDIIGKGKVYFVSKYLKKKSLFAEDGTQEDRRVLTVKIKLSSDSFVLIGSKVDCTIFL